MDQIAALIDISEICEQRIVNTCTNNMLSDVAWWTDRAGNKIEYWDGTHPIGTKGCKCSLDVTGCTLDGLGQEVWHIGYS